MKTIAPRTKTPVAKGTASGNSAKIAIPHELVAQQIGGHLALDFCNTAGEHLAPRPDELLCDWESFLRWATQVGLIGPESYFELLGHPESLVPIIRLREAVYRTGLGVAGVGRFSERDLALIRANAD